MPTATVKNWSQFQHYKDRSPPWVKLHRALLDDFDYACLPIASKALAPLLWLLAAENMDGRVNVSATWLAFRLRWPQKDVEAGLKPLITSGFLVLDEPALAECLQAATPETEAESLRGRGKASCGQAAQDEGFDIAWDTYPKRGGSNSRADALRAWCARIGEGEAKEVLIAGVQRYAAFARATGKERTEFVMQGVRFFGKSKHYLENWETPAQPSAVKAPGKTMQALMSLEEMKHGVVPSRGHNGHPEAGVLGLGASAGWGSPAGHGNGLAGSPRLALGSGNGHAPDSRGVLDLGPDGYRLADTWEAD